MLEGLTATFQAFCINTCGIKTKLSFYTGWGKSSHISKNRKRRGEAHVCRPLPSFLFLFHGKKDWSCICGILNTHDMGQVTKSTLSHRYQIK